MKANVSKIAGALLVLALLAALPAAALAENDDGTMEKKERPDMGTPDGRHFGFDRDLRSVRMNAFLSEGGSASSMSFHIEARDGLSAGYGSSYRNGSGGEDLFAWIDILGVVEYIDVNGNGVYDPLEDKVASTLPLSERFGYLEFIPKDDRDPPVPPNGGDYRKGYSIGYEIGIKWGTSDLQSGLEYNPDHREHLKEYFGGNESTGSVKEHRHSDEFLKGLKEGYIAGYDAGYGIAYVDPAIEPETRGETGSEKARPVPDENSVNAEKKERRQNGERKELPDRKNPDKPEMWPHVIRSYFEPLKVITEKYDQESYALSCSVVDRTGVFHAKIGIAGQFFGEGIVVPDRVHLGISIVNYTSVSSEGRLAIIACSGSSYSSFSGKTMNATPVTDRDYMPLWEFSVNGEKTHIEKTTWEKHESSWEDLRSKGKTLQYGLIYSIKDATVPPTDDGNETEKDPLLVSDLKTVSDKGSILPILITAGIALATLAAIAVLGVVVVAIYRKGRSVW